MTETSLSARSDSRPRRPALVIGNEDHEKLLALGLAGAGSEAGDDLLDEVERARVVPQAKLPADAVRMGARVTYRAGTTTRTVTLAYPADADISAGRVSVLTPIGTALIGLRAGQKIGWEDRNGHPQVLEIVSVEVPPVAN
ncbi:MAG: nucleoside diphosphate kinase regulator [Devosia sp.]